MADYLNINFPSQKKSYSKKNKQWRKDCVNAGESNSVWRNETLRKSFYNKRVNYDLYADILDQSDVERVCNPMGIMGLASPAKMQNYPISNPKIDLLVGESIKRRFDWKVRVLNDDAISSKETEQKKLFMELLTRHIAEEIPEEEREAELKKLQQFVTYEFQDLRERTATQILSYLYTTQRLDYKFSKGFKDALICSEEVFQCDIVAGEPVVMRWNPLNVHILRAGESPYIEDADVICLVGYMSPGKIIDDYHDYLTDADINLIESRFAGATDADSAIDIGYKPDLAINIDEALDLAVLENNLSYGSPFDNDGNIRVSKVYWKSLRKMQRVTYYDEFGDEQEELFDEAYKVDKDKGEKATIIWISEWWEGHKIGGSGINQNDDNAIYCRMQPRPVQFRSMENPSKCHPGIVGTIYNTNDNEGVSLMDRMKPYQYLYNILAYNVELMIAKNKGKIMALDLAFVPADWEIDKWLSYAEGMNIAVRDSFKEGNKGAAQGKIAGATSAQSPVIDMEMGNSIQLYMNMMSYIKQELGEICGVSQARQGQISSSQAVGNVEREINQTSHITEYWFLEHDYVKIRVLETLLETAKHAWKDKKNKKIQYVLDDGASVILNIDGEQFNESEYGISINNSQANQELLQTMKQLAHAGLQNGLLNFSQLLDIYSTESMASIRRKIQRAEEEKIQQAQENEKRAQEIQRESLQAQAMEAEKARNFVREEWERDDKNKEADRENKIIIERMRQENLESRSYKETTSEKDHITLEKLKLDADKLAKDHQLKSREISEKERHNKAVENIQKNKNNKE